MKKIMKLLKSLDSRKKDKPDDHVKSNYPTVTRVMHSKIEGGSMPQSLHISSPGLEDLFGTDKLLIRQQARIRNQCNKYVVKNSIGESIYNAVEESELCYRMFCAKNREFDMKFTDDSNNEVIRLHRPYSCPYPCCEQRCIKVFSPPGTVVGTVEKEITIQPLFDVKNASEDVVYKIKGPLLLICPPGIDLEFKIFSQDGETEVGKISKQWSGLVREIFTDADNFAIYFPMDMDVIMKATLLGACILIDYLYFES